MNFEESYKLDTTTETGVWRTLKSGLQVKVASLRSPAYKMAVLRLEKQYADQINIRDDKVIIMITCKAMAETILLDWKGATDLDENDLPYSQEAAEQMLIKYEIFREDVSNVSVADDNYKVSVILEK